MANNVNKEIIQIVVRGGKKAKKEVNGVSNGLTSLAKKAALAAGAFFGTRGMISAFKELTQQGSKLRTVGQAFDNMGAKIGFTSASLEKFRKATNNTVSDIELMTKANNAMALGIIESDDEFADLIDTAQRLGAALGQDTASALDSLVTGMGRQSKLMLDNLGIMVDTQKAYDDYALSIGKTSSQLDDSEKKIAFNNAAMSEAKRIVGEMGPETETADMKMQGLSATFSNMTAKLGDALTPKLKELTESFQIAATAVTEFLLRQTETKTETAIRNLKEMGVDTKELELSFLNLEKSKAMSKLGESALTVGTNMETVKNLQEEIQTLTDEQTDIQQGRADVELKILELTKGKTSLEKERNKVSSEGFFIGDAKLLQELEFLDTQRVSFEQDQEIFNAKVDAINAEIKLRQDLENKIIQTQALENEGLDKKQDKVEKIHKTETKNNTNLLKQITEGIDEEVKALMEAEQITKGKDISKGVSNAYIMAEEAYKAMAAIPIIGPALGTAAAAVAFAFGMKQVAGIKKAQYGADFVTDGPQMMMVGEGGGPERVQVTPLADPNIEGPQGQGITLNISGNVLHESFVEDNIIPQIREGLRLGENMGV